MEYIVLDLEWNQPVSKWRTVTSPVRLRGEIIQIGAVKVNEKLDILDTFNVKVKPVYYTRMNKRVSDLTGMQAADLEDGLAFPDAAEQFRTWCGGCPFVTWGPDDVRMLEDNLLIHDMDLDWLPAAYDAQMIFDDQVTMEGRQYALNYAMFFFGVKPLAAHDALNDTINTVKVLRNLSFLRGIQDQMGYCALEAG